MTNLKETLADEFLSYFNDYLTIDLYAEHRVITKTEADIILALGRQYHEERASK